MIGPGELETLYRLIGKGIWHLQHLEDALSTCITVKHDVKESGPMGAAEAEAVLAKRRRHTLGTALRIAREEQLLSESVLERMQSFKEERDWLVHRSLHESGDSLQQDEETLLLFDRLEAFSAEALALQCAIGEELQRFVLSRGISPEHLLNEFRRHVDRSR